VRQRLSSTSLFMGGGPLNSKPSLPMNISRRLVGLKAAARTCVTHLPACRTEQRTEPFRTTKGLRSCPETAGKESCAVVGAVVLRNYTKALCESPAVLKETIRLAYLALLFTNVLPRQSVRFAISWSTCCDGFIGSLCLHRRPAFMRVVSLQRSVDLFEISRRRTWPFHIQSPERSSTGRKTYLTLGA
jgi:hypothetical protein